MRFHKYFQCLGGALWIFFPLPLNVLWQRQANQYNKTSSVLIISELRHFSFGAKPFLRVPLETVETPKILYLGYNLATEKRAI